MNQQPKIDNVWIRFIAPEKNREWIPGIQVNSEIQTDKSTADLYVKMGSAVIIDQPIRAYRAIQ